MLSAGQMMSNFVERLFSRRPRVLNALHSVSLVKPTGQTIPVELNALERYATGACQALEIGTDQGVSAARIARALAPTGLLYCVDPWPEGDRGEHPCLSICQRHLRRSGVKRRVRILRGLQQRDDGPNSRQIGLRVCRWRPLVGRCED
jgi:predicted O-methyltransferase YrrM